MILITGATGASGRPIVQRLSSAKVPFKALVRDVKKAQAMFPGVNFAQGDLSDRPSLDRALQGVDRVLVNSGSDPGLVELQSNVVHAAVAAGAKHIVKFSVDRADVKSPMRFMRIHGEVENLIKSSGLEWTMLQPTFFMQNFIGYAGMVDQGALYQPAGEGGAGYVDLGDIAAVAVAALTEDRHNNASYVLTGPENLSLRQIAAIFTRVLGRKVEYVDIPPEAAKKSMLEAGLPEWSVDGVLELLAGVRNGALAGVSDDIRAVTGRNPATFEHFLSMNRSAFAA